LTGPALQGKIPKYLTHSGKMTEKEIKYQRIVDAYQQARKDPKMKEKAKKLFELSREMEKSGDISENVIMGMKYL
jgi:hypothetical protein